jgi:secondary thiamine-phosphate synthase enzyme
VTDLVNEQTLADGFVWISIPHTTGALFLSEADAELLADLEKLGKELLRPYEPFRHRKNGNPNGAAHIFASLIGSQLVLPVVGGRVQMGEYQHLIFLELDGPRLRRLQLASLPSDHGREAAD